MTILNSKNKERKLKVTTPNLTRPNQNKLVYIRESCDAVFSCLD